MEKPTPKELREAVPSISQSYASMILSGERTPAKSLAIVILRAIGWRHSVLDGLTDEEIDLYEKLEPWTPRREQSLQDRAA